MTLIEWWVCQEKEELEPWLVKEMDQLLSDIWLAGRDEGFSQIFHLVLSENATGQWQWRDRDTLYLLLSFETFQLQILMP